MMASDSVVQLVYKWSSSSSIASHRRSLILHSVISVYRLPHILPDFFRAQFLVFRSFLRLNIAIIIMVRLIKYAGAGALLVAAVGATQSYADNEYSDENSVGYPTSYPTASYPTGGDDNDDGDDDNDYPSGTGEYPVGGYPTDNYSPPSSSSGFPVESYPIPTSSGSPGAGDDNDDDCSHDGAGYLGGDDNECGSETTKSDNSPATQSTPGGYPTGSFPVITPTPNPSSSDDDECPSETDCAYPSSTDDEDCSTETESESSPATDSTPASYPTGGSSTSHTSHTTVVVSSPVTVPTGQSPTASQGYPTGNYPGGETSSSVLPTGGQGQPTGSYPSGETSSSVLPTGGQGQPTVSHPGGGESPSSVLPSGGQGYPTGSYPNAGETSSVVLPTGGESSYVAYPTGVAHYPSYPVSGETSSVALPTGGEGYPTGGYPAGGESSSPVLPTGGQGSPTGVNSYSHYPSSNPGGFSTLFTSYSVIPSPSSSRVGGVNSTPSGPASTGTIPTGSATIVRASAVGAFVTVAALFFGLV
ncbi:hypothetical protein GGS21DRAFT_73229 [Xylaria nigripes]|nr:hypothetical protein GGS21DRAFT_73229 [Xylaria nigripes]